MPPDPPDPTVAAPPRRGAAIVAIDGPAGSGKSTVARRVAADLGVPHLDTGAFYRAVTLACLRAGVDPADAAACTQVAAGADVDRRDGRTYLDGRDVEDEIRGPRVTDAVSVVAAHAGVRAAVTPRQRELAAASGGVVEGRDIGTVVLPDANLKVYLTASLEERARRRAADVAGSDYALVRDELLRRDDLDGSRAVAPLAPAPDAWQLDTTELGIGEVVRLIVARAREVLPPVARAVPRVVVVGRPNVGKSTLVNRLVGDRVAIVEKKPGVTRDRTEHRAMWRGRDLVVVDTGGWEHDVAGGRGDDQLAVRVVEQAERAMTDADLVLLVVDVTVGALDDDERVARRLRRAGTTALVVANKADTPALAAAAHDLHGLGLGPARTVSARHGRGVGDLLDAVVAHLPEVTGQAVLQDAVGSVAIVGRPNVGKSSLLNQLAGRDVAIVDPRPHTTRDAIDSFVQVDTSIWRFIDTAGLRRRHRHGDDTERFSVSRARDAIGRADLVLFVVDASQPLGEQDQRLAALVRDAGRGVVLVLNKWDLVDADRRHDLERELDRLLSFATFAPRVNLSARTGRGVRRIGPQLHAVLTAYRMRVPTSELNGVIAVATAQAPPPPRAGRPVRIKYATQAETAPPRFVVFANAALPEPYKRYLERELRARYGFTGVPIRIDDRSRGVRPRAAARRRDARRGPRTGGPGASR